MSSPHDAAPDAPTPETDRIASPYSQLIGDNNQGYVSAQFARNLERQRDAAIERAEKFKWQVRDTCARAEAAERELSASQSREKLAKREAYAECAKIARTASDLLQNSTFDGVAEAIERAAKELK